MIVVNSFKSNNVYDCRELLLVENVYDCCELLLV